MQVEKLHRSYGIHSGLCDGRVERVGSWKGGEVKDVGGWRVRRFEDDLAASGTEPMAGTFAGGCLVGQH